MRTRGSILIMLQLSVCTEWDKRKVELSRIISGFFHALVLTQVQRNKNRVLSGLEESEKDGSKHTISLKTKLVECHSNFKK